MYLLLDLIKNTSNPSAGVYQYQDAIICLHEK